MKRIRITAGTLLLLAFFSCTVPAFSASPPPMEVFVSVPPQKWISEQIGGRFITTHVLVGKGQDPHTYEPTPQQIGALSRAQLYFTLDLQFEGQIIPRLQKTVPDLRVIDMAASIAKIPMIEHDKDEPRDAEHARGGDHGTAKQMHDHQAGLDPHVWLSPVNLKIMATNMAQAMIETDPANKSTYEHNLLATNKAIDQVHQRVEGELAPYQGASFYVFHPAFGYFAQAYHLHQKAIETGGKSPSPRQLAALITEATAGKARVIFVQPQFDPKSAQTVATAINGEVVPLDPLAEEVLSNIEIMAHKVQAALVAQ